MIIFSLISSVQVKIKIAHEAVIDYFCKKKHYKAIQVDKNVLCYFVVPSSV